MILDAFQIIRDPLKGEGVNQVFNFYYSDFAFAFAFFLSFTIQTRTSLESRHFLK